MNTVFDIEQKQDSAEKLAAVANKETKYILFAGEFNDVVRKAVESAIDNISLDFTWGKNVGFIENINSINRAYLLQMKMRESWVLNEADQVWLIIDRYKPQKKVRIKKYKMSGFKHGIFPDQYNEKRPSEILITSSNMKLDIGSAYYFQNPPNVSYEPRALGYGRKNTRNNRAWVYLQFRLKVIKGDKVFFSKPKGVIEINVRLRNESVLYRVLSYKLV